MFYIYEHRVYYIIIIFIIFIYMNKVYILYFMSIKSVLKGIMPPKQGSDVRELHPELLSGGGGGEGEGRLSRSARTLPRGRTKRRVLMIR